MPLLRPARPQRRTTVGPSLAALVAVLVILLCGCTERQGAAPGDPRAGTIGTAATPAEATPGTAAGQGLADPRSCPAAAGFTCATLSVPLDHTGTEPGTLALQVAMAGNAGAPCGVLVLLAGGPGQPGAGIIGRLHDRLGPAVTSAYRLVMLDQRGTGGGALDCPALQASVG